MANYLLDSSVIIDVLNRKQHRDLLLRELLAQGHMLACCAIQVAEVCAGMRPHEEDRTEELLRSLDYYEISWDVARRAGLLRREYVGKGKGLSVADTIIAAVALHHNLTLMTDNVRHYPMPELRLYPLPRSTGT